MDPNTLVGKDINRYTITRYIASGSFGNVFEARNKKTNEYCALKIPIISETRNSQTSLLEEAKIYKDISNPEKGIAEMKITCSKDVKMIVMDLLGPSLESMLSKYKKFGLKTVICLAIKMLEVIKYIHSCGYIHRDLKPDNFVVGHNNTSKLYCIDFGLAKKYIKRNGQHIPFSDHRKFCGTVRYASIAAHKMCEQSRKDDLEAIGYILVYLFKGKLPWQNLKHKDKRERYKIVGDRKESITEEELTEGMPKEFLVYLKYTRNLDFDEKPHYSSLIRMFRKLYESRNYRNDKLEWQ
ncbi:hypothetical protein EB118_06060 [bacterium]|nr:hypothetical protein [bacterium]NDC93777.1 hypothetical protein [bacterium]NDD83110.1 hypothetical protein [bacterium]NDG29643.1 hypothetical protein [bacterium]